LLLAEEWKLNESLRMAVSDTVIDSEEFIEQQKKSLLLLLMFSVALYYDDIGSCAQLRRNFLLYKSLGKSKTLTARTITHTTTHG